MSIESRLRALSDPERWADLPQPRPVVRRPRRVVPMLAAAAAVVLVVGTVIGVSRIAHPDPTPAPSVAPHSDGAVPWLDAAAGPVPRVPTNAPVCRMSQLSAEPIKLGGGGMGTYTALPRVTNQGPTCSLPQNSIRLVGRGRTLARLRPGVGVGVLGPGESVGVLLSHPDSVTHCDLVNRHRDVLELVMAGGMLSKGRQPFTRCAGWSLTTYDLLTAQDSGTGPYSSLRVQVVPRSARIHHDHLDYQIRLTNRGKRDLTFDGCPSYTEKVGAEVPMTVYLPTTRSRYRLNCAGIGTIPPGKTRVVDMEAPVPNTARLRFDEVTITWVLDDGPRASGRLRIPR